MLTPALDGKITNGTNNHVSKSQSEGKLQLYLLTPTTPSNDYVSINKPVLNTIGDMCNVEVLSI